MFIVITRIPKCRKNFVCRNMIVEQVVVKVVCVYQSVSDAKGTAAKRGSMYCTPYSSVKHWHYGTN